MAADSLDALTVRAVVAALACRDDVAAMDGALGRLLTAAKAAGVSRRDAAAPVVAAVAAAGNEHAWQVLTRTLFPGDWVLAPGAGHDGALLHHAAAGGSVAILCDVLAKCAQAGAAVGAACVRSDGRTPLLLAVEARHAGVVVELLGAAGRESGGAAARVMAFRAVLDAAQVATAAAWTPKQVLDAVCCIATAMRAHERDAEVMACGCWALRAIVTLDHAARMPTAVDAGCVAAIVSALELHAERCAVVAEDGLAVLTFATVVSTEARAAAAAAMAALQAHGAHRTTVAGAALRVLERFAGAAAPFGAYVVRDVVDMPSENVRAIVAALAGPGAADAQLAGRALQLLLAVATAKDGARSREAARVPEVVHATATVLTNHGLVGGDAASAAFAEKALKLLAAVVSSPGSPACPPLLSAVATSAASVERALFMHGATSAAVAVLGLRLLRVLATAEGGKFVAALAAVPHLAATVAGVLPLDSYTAAADALQVLLALATAEQPQGAAADAAAAPTTRAARRLPNGVAAAAAAALRVHGGASKSAAEPALRLLAAMLSSVDSGQVLVALGTASNAAALVTALHAHGAANAVLAECALQLLVAIQPQPGVLAAVGSDAGWLSVGVDVPRAFAAVSAVLTAHGATNAVVAARALRLLCAMMMPPPPAPDEHTSTRVPLLPGQQQGGSDGLVAAIMTALHKHAGTRAVAEDALEVLACVLRADGAARGVVDAPGSAFSVLAVLRAHGDASAKVAEAGLSLFALMTRCGERVPEDVPAADMVAVVGAVLSAHGVGTEAVAGAALRLLEGLACADEARFIAAVEHAPIIARATVAALDAHGARCDVIGLSALRVLHATAALKGGAGVRVPGCVAAIVGILRAHGAAADPSLAAVGLELLVVLARPPPAPSDGAPDAVPVVMALLRAHGRSSQAVAAASLWLLTHADGAAVASAAMSASECITAVTGALAAHGTASSAVAVGALRVLDAMCAAAPAAYVPHVAATTGALAAVVAALRRHGTTSVAAAAGGLRVLAALAASRDKAHAASLAAEPGAVAAAVAALRAHCATSAAVVAAGLNLFYHVTHANNGLLAAVVHPGGVVAAVVAALQAPGGRSPVVFIDGILTILTLACSAGAAAALAGAPSRIVNWQRALMAVGVLVVLALGAVGVGLCLALLDYAMSGRRALL